MANKLFKIYLAALLIVSSSLPAFAQRSGGAGMTGPQSNVQSKQNTQLTAEVLASVEAREQESAFRGGTFKELNSFSRTGGVTGTTDLVGPVLQQVVGDETTYSDLEILLDDKIRTVTWPPPPRAWVERYREKSHVTKVFIGPLSVPYITANLTNEFQYRVVTSFLMFGSLRDAQGASPKAKVSDNLTTPASNDHFKFMPLMRNFTYTKGAFEEAYPNATSDHPMVGMCAFQMTHRIAVSEEFGLKLVVIGGSDERTTVDGVNFAFFSNFFPLDRNKSIDWYQSVFCTQGFAKYVQPSIEEDFRRTTQSMVRKELSSCTPPEDKVVKPNGDDSCVHWFADNFALPFQKNIREQTVPRCIPNKFGIYSCKLATKEGHLCPVYYNGKDGKFYDTFQGLYSKTQASDGFECDHNAGLACKIDLKWSLDLRFAGSHGIVSGICRKGPRELKYGKSY